MMIDTHCHLQFNVYKDDLKEVIKRCSEKDVICITVGTQKDTSRAAVELAEKYDFIYASIGLHPIHATSSEIDEEEIAFKTREEDFDEKYYSELIKSKKVVGVGECGIDLFHIPEGSSVENILKKQKKVFLDQYYFAKKNNLPLIIHTRDAHNEMIELIKDLDISGVMHCYASNWDNAKRYLDKGLYIGLTGVITFPPKKTNPKIQEDLLEVVKNTPLEKILIETDAPYLAPQKYRGERCEPWMVLEVAKKISEIKKIPYETVVTQTVQNAKKLFKI